jgi:LysR family transcriptional regulator for metE and metH
MIIETRHLQLMVAIARHGTLTQAGQSLDLTQSALSHQLANLEARLRISLFHRLGKRMTVTSAGARLLVTAERTLAELERAEDDVRRGAAGWARLLRVSTECYTAYHWLPRILRTFEARFPDVDVQIVADATRNPLTAVQDGRVDIAVMMSRYSSKHLRAFPLFDDEMVVVVSADHPLAARPYVEIEDLAREHLLVYSPLAEGTSFTGALLRAAGVTPRRESRVQLTEAIVELVEAGLGVSVLARWAIAPRATHQRVAMVRLTPAGVHRRWHAVVPRASATQAHVREFVKLLSMGPPTLATRSRPRSGTSVKALHVGDPRPARA